MVSLVWRNYYYKSFLYGAEAKTMFRSDSVILEGFEREILCEIFDPVFVGNDFRKWTNKEL